MGCSIEISCDIYMSVYLLCPKCVGGITWPTRMINFILGWIKMTCDTRVIDLDYALEQLYHGQKRNVHLKLKANSASAIEDRRSKVEDKTRN